MTPFRLSTTLLALLLLLFACSTTSTSVKERAEGKRKLGMQLMSQGETTEGLKQLLEAEKVYADDPDLQNDLGYAYLAKEKPELAVGHFQKALRLKPDFGEARNNLGVTYLELGNLDAAIAALLPLTEDLLYPTPHFPLTNLGLAYYRKGQYGESVRYYLAALKERPRFLKAMRGLGLTYMAMGKGVEAVGILRKAVELAPKAQLLYLDLARAYRLAGDIPGAEETYRALVRVDPYSETAAEARKALQGLK